MDAKEFKERVLPASRKIFRYANRLLNNEHDAEDVVQEIWLKLWDKREQLGNIKNMEAFAFRMTRNLCLDKIKLKKPQYFDDREEGAYRYDGADHQPDPESSLELKDTMERVNQIIGRLPEQQKTLLQLRDVEGLEYEEIASMTGLEINAIRVNISRARKNVRETIQKVYQSWKI
jgi:RNA polymerase sigma-70 factor (ECF subfamily)